MEVIKTIENAMPMPTNEGREKKASTLDLIEEIAKEANLPVGVVAKVIELLPVCIRNILLHDNKQLVLRNLGIFRIQEQEAGRKHFIPSVGKTVTTKRRASLRFRAKRHFFVGAEDDCDKLHNAIEGMRGKKLD